MKAGSWPHLMVDLSALAACAALSAAFYFAGVRPLQARAEADRAGRERIAALTDDATRARASRAEVADRIGAARARARDTAVTLERTDRLNARVQELNALARANGLEIDEIRPGSPDGGAWFTRVPVRIAGNGPFRAGLLFLHRLNREFPDMGLAGLELRGDPATDDTPALFMFDLVWYAAPATTADAGK